LFSMISTQTATQAMQRLSGMPAHGELIPWQARRAARAPAAHHERRAHQVRQPRVLKGWQKWIAAHIGRPLP
jgi:hypothetical protein